MSNVTLALTFAAPWIAWTGVAGAAVPIIIHLLNRRRYRLVEWAAMRFLLESQRRNRRRLRVEELLLLALRCLLILLVGLAIARPQSSTAILPIATRAAESRYIILDDSASMGVKRGSGTTFAAADEDLAHLAENLPKEDQLAIYLTSMRGKPWFALKHPAPKDNLLPRLKALTVSDTRGGLAETLSAVGQAITEKGSGNVNKVDLVSDFRRVDFSPGQAGKALGQQLSALVAGKAELAMIDHGLAVSGNLTVEQVVLRTRQAIVNTETWIGVTIRNHGEQAVNEVRLKVEIGDVVLPARVLAGIPAGQSRTVEVPCVFPVVGPAVVKVQLGADSLEADNAAWLALNVHQALQVLIVDGEVDPANPQRSESFFLKFALDPLEDGSFGNKPEVRSYENIAGEDFGRYDLVILAGVPELPGEMDDRGGLVYPTLEALKRYVAEGGGLAIFTGEKINLEFYNGPMFDNGAGLSPMRMSPAVGDAGARQKFVTFRTSSAVNIPMLRAFQADTEEFARRLRFYRYNPAVDVMAVNLPASVGAARTLIRFSDDSASPAIVERRLGKGTVMMFYSTASTRWNDWGKATTLTYLPVMNDMVAYLARSGGDDLTAPVGTPIRLGAAELRGQPRVNLKTPGSPLLEELPVDTRSGQRELVYPDTRWAGVYELTLPGGGESDRAEGPAVIRLARNIDPAEGDLAKATRGELTAAVGSEAYTYIDRNKASASAPGMEPLREYWRWLLLAVLLLAALEVFLGQRFGHYTTPRQDKAR